MGLTYERKVWKFFKRTQERDSSFPRGSILYQQWFSVEPSNLSKPQFFCPDLLLVGPRAVVLFEIKLTQTELAAAQLRRYAPMIEEFFSLPTILCCVFKNLLQRPPALITNLSALHPTTLNHYHLFL